MPDYLKALRFAGKANDAVSTCNSFITNVNKARTWWEDKHAYTVSVSAKDSTFYIYVMDWLDERIPKADKRNVEMVYSAQVANYVDRSNDSVTHNFILNGSRVKVEIKSPPSLSEMIAQDIGGIAKSGQTDKKEIVFAVSSSSAQQMVLDELHAVWDRMQTGPRKPYLWTLTHNGGWAANNYLQERELSSVVLPDGQVDRIVSDMTTFRNSKASYAKLGLPYHRGYIFYGPPGTGKTSLAKAISNHFKLDLYYMPLGAVQSDLNLMSAFAALPMGAILLLEDVDVFAAMQNREDEKKDQHSFSLSGLLNVLDGVMSPDGLMTIMTTNDIEKIDSAILRPGRVDMIEKLDNLVAGQAEDIFFSFYGRYPTEALEAEGRSPSEIVNALKQHMHDPEMAERAILKKERVDS